MINMTYHSNKLTNNYTLQNIKHKFVSITPKLAFAPFLIDVTLLMDKLNSVKTFPSKTPFTEQNLVNNTGRRLLVPML